MCQFMADPGPCQGKNSVFGYDPFMNACNYFNYGGCGGNPNRFSSYSECHKACIMTRNIYEGGDTNKSEETSTDPTVDYYGDQTDEPDKPDKTENPDGGEYGEDGYGDGDGDSDGDSNGDSDGDSDGDGNSENGDNKGEITEPDPEMETSTANIEDTSGNIDYNEQKNIEWKDNESVEQENEEEYNENLEEAK